MKRTISLAMIDRLRPKAREYHLWDRDQPGFGVRVRTSGHRSFIFKRRVDGKLINHTLGDAAKMPLVQARKMAARIQQDLYGIEYLDGPSDADLHRPPCPTFAAFVVETFWPWALSKWKPGSIDASETYMRTQLMPNFGQLRLDEITNRHIAAWFDRYSAKSPGGANRALDDLKVIFTKAVQWDYLHASPISGIRKNPKRKMTRFLSRAEITRLSEVLVELESEGTLNKQPANIVRLLLLTGCRHREITTLKWAYIDGNVIHLPDSKTGPRDVHLSDAAMGVLQQIKTRRWNAPKDRCEWVFPAPKTPRARPGNVASHEKCQPPIWYFWKHVCTRAGFGPTRIHDLRHTFASQAALQGHGLIAVKNMLGHKSLNMTMAYVHVHDPEAAQAAVKMANIICDIMAGEAVNRYQAKCNSPPDKGLGIGKPPSSLRRPKNHCRIVRGSPEDI